MTEDIAETVKTINECIKLARGVWPSIRWAYVWLRSRRAPAGQEKERGASDPAA